MSSLTPFIGRPSSSLVNGEEFDKSVMEKGQKMRCFSVLFRRLTLGTVQLPRVLRCKYLFPLLGTFAFGILVLNVRNVDYEFVNYLDVDTVSPVNLSQEINSQIVSSTLFGVNKNGDETLYWTDGISTGVLKKLYGAMQRSKEPLEFCSEIPNGLLGKLYIPSHSAAHNGNIKKIMQDIENQNRDLEYGGRWEPQTCRANQSLALIIPYRNRSEHLSILLTQLHQMLKRQLLRYQIFVVEQFGEYEYNKARLMNVAFDYVNKSEDYSYDCFIFHDVDLIPENDNNLYRCEEYPRHLSPAVSTLRYKLPYKELIGGVLAITPEMYERVNGYSNLYWGWGGEDDDMFYRIEAENLTVSRPALQIGKYKMIKHQQRPAKDGKVRFKLVWSAKERYKKDGVAQLSSLNFTIVFVEKYLLYTHIMVDLGVPPKK